MKSYQVFENAKPIKEVEISTPSPKGNEVLIKTIACGVCHTDIHIHDGFFDIGNGKKMASRLVQPIAMGHEVFGEVVAVGQNVIDIELGRKFVVYPWIGCGECEACKSDNEHECGPFTAQNIGVSVDGGYGEYVLVKDSKYLFDAGNTPDDLAGSYACRGLTAYSSLKKANLKPNDKKLVIISAGGLGLLALKIAKAAFNVSPIVVDIDDSKLEIAKAAGASEVINSSHENAKKRIMELTGGGASTVIDYVGAEASIEFGYDLFGFNKNGLYILVGMLGGKFEVQLPLMTFSSRVLQGSYLGSIQEMKELMELVKAEKIEPVPVETRHISMANDTIADLKAGKIPGLVCLKH